MLILGYGGSIHDFSYCLLEDEHIVCAIEEERISREKYGIGKVSLLARGAKYCLDERPGQKPDMVVANDLLLPQFKEAHAKDAVIINHHLSHAAGVFYTSGYEDAAILVADGRGSEHPGAGIETVSFYHGIMNEIRLVDRIAGEEKQINHPYFRDVLSIDEIYTNSIGDFYSVMTRVVGFQKNEDGKLMGLAPYGTDRFVPWLQNYVRLGANGQITVEYDDSFFGEIQSLLNSCSDDIMEQVRLDLAYGTQYITEVAMIHMANYLYELTRCKNICVGGGVALNSVANGKIAANSSFDNVYVMPASGDSGTSLGAALYGYYGIHKMPRNQSGPIPAAYLGKVYSNDFILHVLEKYQDQLIWKEMDDNSLCEHAAENLYHNKILGWFQGKSEFGPRALGCRSILANACHPDMKDILNARVKFREEFRPFAPSVHVEAAKEYFDMDCEETAYMLKVYPVKEEMRKVLPSITHVDGSARIQTVSKKNNEIYYQLIESFKRRSGVPVILNTSFNVKGEPIVETPKDAVNCFLSTNLDLLYIGSYEVYKK